MGSVERMLLNFCTKEWDAEDEVTRNRIARRWPRILVPTRKPFTLGVWRCFYRRHPDTLRGARSWSRTVSMILDQLEAEDAADAAMKAMEGVLMTHQRSV